MKDKNGNEIHLGDRVIITAGSICSQQVLNVVAMNEYPTIGEGVFRLCLDNGNNTGLAIVDPEHVELVASSCLMR